MTKTSFEIRSAHVQSDLPPCCTDEVPPGYWPDLLSDMRSWQAAESDDDAALPPCCTYQPDSHLGGSR